MFAALAYVSVLVLRIPVGFLTFDFKDVLITVCGLFYGPLSALTLSVIVPLLEYMTISGTKEYGLIMNFLSTAAFAVTASFIYKYKKTLFGALVGLICGVLAMTAVMMAANLFITPYFMKVPTKEVAAMLPTVFLPFNLTKAVLNAAITVILYKPISKALRATRLSGKPVEEDKKGFDAKSLLVLGIAIAIALAALAVMLLVLGGKISVFDVFMNK